MATAVESLLKSHDGDIAIVAQETGYGQTTLEELLMLLKLPDEIQDLLKSHDLGYEAHKLVNITPKSRKIQLANALVGMSTKDVRALIEYAKKNKELAVVKCKEAVVKSKTVKEKIFMVLVELSEEQYVQLKQKAERKRLSADTLATSVIREWLESD